jgi:hypothetical protein
VAAFREEHGFRDRFDEDGVPAERAGSFEMKAKASFFVRQPLQTLCTCPHEIVVPFVDNPSVFYPLFSEHVVIVHFFASGLTFT